MRVNAVVILRIGLIVSCLSECHHQLCEKVALLMTTIVPAKFNNANLEKSKQTHNNGRQTDNQQGCRQHS